MSCKHGLASACERAACRNARLRWTEHVIKDNATTTHSPITDAHNNAHTLSLSVSPSPRTHTHTYIHIYQIEARAQKGRESLTFRLVPGQRAVVAYPAGLVAQIDALDHQRRARVGCRQVTLRDVIRPEVVDVV